MKKESLAKNVNRHCLCQTLDRKILKDYLEKDTDVETFFQNRPHLFSETAIYISPDNLEEITDVVQSVETVIKSSSFQNIVLAKAPELSLKDYKLHGAFMGYDFHLTEEGPKLIEINTNAGGGLLNLILARAQVECCDGIKRPFKLESLESEYFEMFLSEWKIQRGDSTLGCIAILDEAPEKQYLFPEFQLFSKLFGKFGLDSVILDPKDLTYKEDGLWFKNKKIDLIYNRSTDFYFVSENYSQIREAYKNDHVVITPNPHHHALYANKFNLEILSNQEALEALGIDKKTISILLSGIPKTMRLTPENKEWVWKNRRGYFFKPALGYGSKATYRGDKVTLRVWEEMNQADYVVQEIAKPGLRTVLVGDEQSELKLDIRAYTYNGKIQLLSSRLYSGQTTNFRTLGGGFAPVFLL